MVRSLLTSVVAAVTVALVGSGALVVSTATRSPAPLYRAALPTCRFLLRIAGVRLTVRGRERLDPGQNYLFVANHASNVDPPLAFVAIGRHTRIVSKASVFRLPVFGKVMRRAGFVSVDRSNRRRAVETVRRGADTLRSGNDLLVFPEGTRTETGRLQAFKRGPFLMAARAGRSVVPVVIRGSALVQPRGSSWIRPAAVDIELLTPIVGGDVPADSLAVLRDGARAAIARALETGPPTPVV